MDDIIPVYVGIAAGVGIVLLCMCSRMTRNTWHIDTALVEAFLAEDNLHHLEHTLQRHDIEELLREVERWECSVCGFLNVVPQPACSLCHTKHGVKLIEPFQHDVVQSHLGTNSSYVGSALFKYSALSSSLHAAWASPITSVRGVKSSMQRATISSTSGKVSSLKRMTASRILHWTSLLHHALLPEDLNHHQRSARMRRQWRRKMDPRNYQVVWVRQFTDHDDFSVAYVIQLVRQLASLPKRVHAVVASLYTFYASSVECIGWLRSSGPHCTFPAPWTTVLGVAFTTTDMNML
ncbi:hypothetical protein, variant 3 [Aphanomyces invadans]|uniref:RanBP2-type domain-containing protein n=1 Tax=Aphanomyces invadans TaxID=157072 RepID=A0A024UHN8_9STRA|nr:hypothetical protein, variant 2 [Aphanomyces invadans]XP_008866815.1 hypothetical protein, variant 3 [Aphanomyces invadans]ETW05377.1 hypothetical protein, variant 2 [Aphanomyces invadans]ETW05378.1 hypothetical protein, variant 3 [Aphanomyces invadans]|eukprot:XP_008866814.1 hypothetical protein, variant 2 [Aphanomyces invadans]